MNAHIIIILNEFIARNKKRKVVQCVCLLVSFPFIKTTFIFFLFTFTTFIHNSCLPANVNDGLVMSKSLKQKGNLKRKKKERVVYLFEFLLFSLKDNCVRV